MLCRERDSCREKDPSRRMRGREEEGCVFEQERNDWSINVNSPFSKHLFHHIGGQTLNS